LAAELAPIRPCLAFNQSVLFRYLSTAAIRGFP
jgi:hypothetical protein